MEMKIVSNELLESLVDALVSIREAEGYPLSIRSVEIGKPDALTVAEATLPAAWLFTGSSAPVSEADGPVANAHRRRVFQLEVRFDPAGLSHADRELLFGRLEWSVCKAFRRLSRGPSQQITVACDDLSGLHEAAAPVAVRMLVTATYAERFG
ncbi:hypothetical protein [Pseudomonas pseudonitroreducens]|uniref:hypothetical protein n=1 Tax=Pseudomonas pseudonitroreducens TaxID=2892326 RepID=UPI001F2111C3|nr:hypothetical protein [Pseudomonas pseudonitroreducens]